MIALRGQVSAGAWRTSPRPISPPARQPTSLPRQAWGWLDHPISCQIHLAQSGNGGKADTLCAGLENRSAIGACGAQQMAALPAVTALHRWVLDGIWPISGALPADPPETRRRIWLDHAISRQIYLAQSGISEDG
jgi:hypothetical protein